MADEHNARIIMNSEISAHDFTVEVMSVDEEGNAIIRLREFSSTIFNWVFRPTETEPYVVEDEDPSEDEDEGDHQEIELEDEGMVVEPEDESELILEHRITGAAIKELQDHVFTAEATQLIAVVITYFVNLENTKHTIFNHVFAGKLYRPQYLSGTLTSHTRKPLRAVSRVDLFGGRVFSTDVADIQIAELMKEYQLNSEEIH
jgi:hypothetical protein